MENRGRKSWRGLSKMENRGRESYDGFFKLRGKLWGNINVIMNLEESGKSWEIENRGRKSWERFSGGGKSWKKIVRACFWKR